MLFNEYYKVLEKTLSNRPKVLCIGYGFNDSHINSLFAKYDIELQVINPQSSAEFYNTFVSYNMLEHQESENKKAIWDKIQNYYETDLKGMFPGGIDKTKWITDLENNFFEGD